MTEELKILEETKFFLRHIDVNDHFLLFFDKNGHYVQRIDYYFLWIELLKLQLSPKQST